MERNLVEADGEPFAVLSAGPEDGAPLLLLHGFPDIPATWSPVVERLAARGYRCHAPYLRGYGGSTRRGPFHVDRIGADAVALADALAPGRPVAILGHDWGAVAAYAALSRAPARFHAAITLAVPHPGHLLGALARHPWAARQVWYMLFFQLPRLPERALTDTRLLEWLWRAWSPGFEAPAGHLDEVRRALARGELAALAYYRALAGSMLRRVPRWAPIRVPTLHVHGARDGCIAASLTAGHERLFEAEVETVLIEAGHFATLEAPARVADLALEWLGAFPPRGADPR